MDLDSDDDSVGQEISDIDFKFAVTKIREETSIVKYCSSPLTKPHARVFFVDMEVLALKWFSPKKNAQTTQMYLVDVVSITPGRKCEFWKNKPKDEALLGLEIISQTRPLRLVFSSRELWKIWMRGLRYAHKKAITKRKRAASLTNDFIRKQWQLADLDQSGSIQFNELIHLLQKLNCQADTRYAEQQFECLDVDGSQVLEYDEFKTFVHRLLTHEDITTQFDKYASSPHNITEAEFRQFMHEVQFMPAAEIDAAVLQMQQLKEPFVEPRVMDDGSSHLTLTDLGFNLVLSSDFNSIVHPWKKRQYQDMNQPLSAYWIASSHNTYLTKDQVVGRSSAGQYKEVLLTGCRCVEIDCWDPPHKGDDPVVYHGHTLTSKIGLAEVLSTIKQYAFQASEFPVILSLEMHCNVVGRKRVGALLQEHLGEALYLCTGTEAALPSPAALKRRFIVKAKKIDGGDTVTEGDELSVRIRHDELAFELLCEHSNRYHVPRVVDQDPVSVIGIDTIDEDEPQLRGDESYKTAVGMFGRRLRLTEEGKRPLHSMCSLDERQFNKLATGKCSQIIEFHRTYLSRVFPVCTRVMSSNFNPMLGWMYGCQCVAINYQTRGMAQLLNLGRFTENGKCGYVLKPTILREASNFNPNEPENHTKYEVPLDVTIKVLAGQQLPRPSIDKKWSAARRDIVCPYVVVTAQGVKSDRLSKATPCAMYNGLNPRWTDQSSFSYHISIPSLAMLTFEVLHFDPIGSEFLAAAAAPVTSIRPGLRWVTLYDDKGRHIPWSGLLVHVAIKGPKVEHKHHEPRPLVVKASRKEHSPVRKR